MSEIAIEPHPHERGRYTPRRNETLLDANSRNREAIFPYIGGEEVNTSPTHAHHRYVINFRDVAAGRAGGWAAADDDRHREWRRRGIVPLDYPESVAADWPAIVDTSEAGAGCAES